MMRFLILIFVIGCTAVTCSLRAQEASQVDIAPKPDDALERGLALLESDKSGDWEAAIGLLEVAASQGAPVYLLIADSWRQGFGVARNPGNAEKWYKIGAETGDGFAQFELGHMYLHGEEIPQDMVQAVFYLQLSVDRLQDPIMKRHAETALSRARLGAGWEDWQKARALIKELKPKSLTDLIN